MNLIKVMNLLVLSVALVGCSLTPKAPPSPPPSGFSSFYSNYLKDATSACQEEAEGIYIMAIYSGVTPQDAIAIAKHQYFECAKELDIII